MTQPSDENPRLGPHNTVRGDMSGNSVQAGYIYGGVHFHLPPQQPAPPPHFPPPHFPPPHFPPTHFPPPHAPPPHVPPPYSAQPHFPAGAPWRRPPGRGEAARGWALALLPFVLLGSVVGGTLEAAVGPGGFGVKLALAGALAAVGACCAWLWSLSSHRGFGAAVGRLLDACTPPRVAALPTATLAVVLTALLALSAYGTADGLLGLSPPQQTAGAGVGAVLTLLSLAAVFARVLVRRRITRNDG